MGQSTKELGLIKMQGQILLLLFSCSFCSVLCDSPNGYFPSPPQPAYGGYQHTYHQLDLQPYHQPYGSAPPAECPKVNETECKPVDKVDFYPRSIDVCVVVPEKKCASTVSKECASVTSQACYTKNEQFCTAMEIQECRTTPEFVTTTVCKAEEIDVCVDVTETKCEEAVKNVCHTVQDTICKDKTTEVCYDKVTVGSKSECVSCKEYSCQNVTTGVVCENVTKTEHVYNEKCDKVPYKDCKKQCLPVYNPRYGAPTESCTDVCTEIEVERCIKKPEEKEVTEQVCKDVTEEVCKNVDVEKCIDVPTVDVDEECVAVKGSVCKTAPREICTPLSRTICASATVPACAKIPTTVCKEVKKVQQKVECGSVTLETCIEAPVTKCKDVTKDVCITVPGLECANVDKKVCAEQITVIDGSKYVTEECETREVCGAEDEGYQVYQAPQPTYG